MNLDVIGDRSNVDIIGKIKLKPDKLIAFVESITSDSSDLKEIAYNYINIGKKYGIRGDIAFCQAVLETDYFRYGNGTAVTPDQHNYAGLGVVRKGLKGNSYPTVKDGVTAHIQHLYAYACDKPIPSGEILIDNRFKYVKRGIAPTWYMLSGTWAMTKGYGDKILNLYKKVLEHGK